MVLMSRLSFYSSFLLLFRLVAAQSSTSDQGSGFNPTKAAIVLILLVSVFSVLGCVVIYKRRWFAQALGRCIEHALGINHEQALGTSHEQALGINDSRSGEPGNWLNVRETSRGLDASVIETFPTFLYSAVKTLKIGKDVLGCSVCLNDFEDDETLRLIPQCCHVFHPGCIAGWLVSQDTCPLCRANLVSVPGESVFFESPGFARETGQGQNSPGTLIDDNRRRVLVSPDERLIDSMARNGNLSTPRKSMSTGRLLAGLFSRTDWTGQPRENQDRFTLKLPQDVHDQLVSQESKGHVELPQVRSPIRGYRTESIGTERNYFYYERFDQDGRLGRRPFSITPPYHIGSIGSPDVVIGSGGNCQERRASPPKSLLLAIRSPFDRLFFGKNNVGERSYLRSGEASPV